MEFFVILFSAQRAEWSLTGWRGAPEETSQHRRAGQDQGGQAKRKRIVWFHLEKERRQRMPGQQGQPGPERERDERLLHSLFHDQRKHIAPVRPRAMRMPISRVRRSTAYAFTP